MARIAPDIKAALTKAGLWDDFVLYRSSQRDLGMRSCDAHNAAIAKYLPKCSNTIEGEPAIEPEAESAETPIIADADIPENFELNRAEAAEQVIWVARALGLGSKASRSDCPDPAAWGMFEECKKSPSFRSIFWQSIYPKLIPSRSQLDDRKPGMLDGEEIVSLIDRIIGVKESAMRGSATEEHQSHALEDAGSTPAPATTPCKPTK